MGRELLFKGEMNFYEDAQQEQCLVDTFSQKGESDSHIFYISGAKLM